MASLAETEELKQVAVYSKPALPGQPLLQFTKIVPGEINNCAAVGTNQMVVVLWRTNCVAVADASGTQLADKFQFSQYLKGTVNSYQSNVRAVLTYLLMYGSRRKVVLAGSDYLYHRLPLRGKLIAMPPQGSYYFSLSKLHLKL